MSEWGSKDWSLVAEYYSYLNKIDVKEFPKEYMDLIYELFNSSNRDNLIIAIEILKTQKLKDKTWMEELINE